MVRVQGEGIWPVAKTFFALAHRGTTGDEKRIMSYEAANLLNHQRFRFS